MKLEAHSSGGVMSVRAAQGGGVTDTFPFEQWRYRYIDGVGQTFTLESVDTSNNRTIPADDGSCRKGTIAGSAAGGSQVMRRLG